DISVTGMLGQEKFHARSSVVRKAGWREIYDAGWQDIDEETDWKGGAAGIPGALSVPPDSTGVQPEKILADLKTGDLLTVSSLSVTEGRTTPPAHFTEGTLIAAMEDPVRY